MLETPRLIIRPAILEDAELFFRIQTQPKWIKYIGDRGLKEVKDAEDKLRVNLKKCHDLNGWELFTVSLKDTNEPIGVASFMQRDYLDYPDIGYAMLLKYEGCGYMTEALKIIRDHGMLALGFTKLLAMIAPKNSQSIKLIARIGFSEIKRIRVENEELILFSN